MGKQGHSGLFNFKVTQLFIFDFRRLRMRAQVKTCALAGISVNCLLRTDRAPAN